MSFRSEWLVEPHILGTSFEQNTSISELNLVMLEYLGVAQELSMYFLLDFSRVNTPTGLLTLPSLLQVINHGNTNWLVLVKAESNSSYMSKMLARDKVKIFHDTDTALSFLYEMLSLDTGQDFSIKV